MFAVRCPECKRQHEVEDEPDLPFSDFGYFCKTYPECMWEHYLPIVHIVCRRMADELWPTKEHAMAKGQLPNVLFIRATGTKHEFRHKHVVFRVEERDEDGIPTKLTLLHKEDVAVSVTDAAGEGVHCVTGYIRAENLIPQPKYAGYRRAE